MNKDANQIMEESLARLNEDQRLAATNYEGAYFILAGPGSGKTATIVQRVAYMIHKGVDPSKIILFTFTNKAASELKERAISIVGDRAKNIVVGTYHSVCAKLLRKYAVALGHYDSNFTIYDTSDSIAILKPLCKDNKLDEKEMLSFISHCKNNMITPTAAYNMANTSYYEMISDIYRDYQSMLESQNAMDFDDLIWNMVKVMEIDQNIRTNLNERFHYILSDEAHDSNPRDLRLIKLLAGHRENVCFVLDPNQSIYGFRGANINAVLNVPNDYKNLTTYQLKTNYRSSKKIVEASEKLISVNDQPENRIIGTINEDGENVYYMEANNAEEEAYRMSSVIKSLVETGSEYKDIAILLRMNYLTRTIEKVLTMSKIPFVVKSSVGFFQRMEIKDLMSFVRLVYNPYDLAAFKRIVNVPKKGIGEKSIQAIIDTQAESPTPISIIDACRITTLKGKAKAGILNFLEIIDSTTDFKNQGKEGHEILDNIIEKTNYMEFLEGYETNISILSDRIDNIKELMNMTYEYESLEQLLEDSSLFAEGNEDDEDENKVQIMTMHSSKGLEWDNVIVGTSIEGVIPHFKSINDKNVDEERRLYYVAMTRAKKRLFLTRPKTIFNDGRVQFTKPSRFIKEIQDHLVVL